MNQYEVDSDRIKPLIEKGIAQVISSNYCESFDEYLCKEYPWVPYSDKIDWIKVEKPYKRFRWDNATVEETTNFLKTTCMKSFKEVCIIYGAKQPGIIVSFEYACKELEHLTIFGWATRCMVGVKRNKYNLVELDYNSFVEIDFADWLTASG